MRTKFLVLTAMLLASACLPLRAQKDAATVDCSVDGRQLTCNRADFLKRFAEAHSVVVESQPKNRIAEAELASFAKRLGKQVAPAFPADMMLRLVRPAETGFGVGPNDVELATLRVFSTKDGDGGGRLIWVETYRGQPDMPWPAVVRAITQQFQTTLAGR